MTTDTGFEDVIAGLVYKHPEPGPVTVAVTTEETQCASSTAAGAAPASPSSPPPSAPSPTTSPGLTPAGVQAAHALVNLPKLDWPTLSHLARDMAMNLKPRQDVIADFKLTQVQYDFLEANNEFYREALRAACSEWHAPMSTQERLKVEAAAILEDSLLGLGARMQNKGEGLPGVIEAAKFFAKVAEVGERNSGGSSSGERVTINIDLGGDQKISVGVAPAPQADAGLALSRAISDDR